MRKPPPIAILPLLLALIALVIASQTSGGITYLAIGVAAATALVGITIIFRYVGLPEAKQVPLENFSLWADVGEPGAELRRLGPDDVEAAVRLASADLGSLATNAELLSGRISLLLDKDEFKGLREKKLHKQIGFVAQDIKEVIRKLRAVKEFPEKTVASLERCAANLDRVANKLFEFERGKSEVVHIYVEPLRRAAEKLSRDLRLASANMSGFARGTSPKEKIP